MVKLNIGAGSTEIEGWIPIDRKLGIDAYPLPKTLVYEGVAVDLDDDSVEEIRASHILEHFTFAEAQKALAEWVRVLKPGGRIRLAVPDVDKCLKADDPNRLFYLMGGQTDSDDIHKSAYDAHRLRGVMELAGLVNIKRWESSNTDCAALPISLNLEGYKPTEEQKQKTHVSVKVAAYMTLPRYVAAAPRQIIERALKPFQIGLTTTQGVFYGQCMQRMFEQAIEDGIDWILALDSDSLFNEHHLSSLMDVFASHPEADALAALQCRRGKGFPLLTVGKENEVETDGSPIKVTTAHFGMTLIRVDVLKEVPKPWFYAEPEKGGTWGDERLDDDIWFWHQWRLAGKSIYVAPSVSIGHMDEMVTMFDEQLQPQAVYMHEWREQFVTERKCPSK